MEGAEAGALAPGSRSLSNEAVAVFNALDKDGDGELTPSELTLRLSDFGLDDGLIELLFYRLDTNSDGAVSKEEFVDGYHEYLHMLTSRGEFRASATAAHGLVATHTSLTKAALPADLSAVGHEGGTVKIHKATYEANDPSEDRSTVVLGKDFVFCGVWDGHGGTPCAEYVESQAFGLFAAAKAAGKVQQAAWEEMYANLDKSYLEHCNKLPPEKLSKALFAGACCNGCFVDLRPGLSCPADQHELLLHSASDLSKTGWGRSDPYCLVTVNGVAVGRTPTRKRTQNPEWQASIQLRGLKEAGENIVRVQILNKDTFSSDDDEGFVEFRGEGLAAFDSCRGRLAPYPVMLNGAAAGKLLCQLQVPVYVGCGNLGDSRAVLGVYESGELRTVPLSTDHSATSPSERSMIEDSHPSDATAVLDGSKGKGRPNWRVKGICAFTRSIGDCQMKDPAAAALYNTKKTKAKVEPRPGIVPPGSTNATRVVPYISFVPEHSAQYLCDGFVICACDGVWDEMSSAEAVQIVSELLADHGPDANIADLFIEKVMEKVLKRMQATYKAERMTTMEELKSRPPGKKAFKKGPPTKWCKSCLHDDITVVILDFTSVAGGSAKSDIATTLFRDKAPASILAAREAFNALDASETGTVTAADVVAASAKMGRKLDEDAAKAFVGEADKDGSGVLLPDEFAAWFEEHAQAEATNRRGGDAVTTLDAIGMLNSHDAEAEPQAELSRANSDGDIMNVFRAIGRATPARFQDAADHLGLTANSPVSEGELSSLLEQLLSPQIDESGFDNHHANEAASVGAGLIFAELSANGTNEFTLTELGNFIESSC